MESQYEYRFQDLSPEKKWSPWMDNHLFFWMQEQMELDWAIVKITVTYDDGSKGEQRRKEGDDV